MTTTHGVIRVKFVAVPVWVLDALDEAAASLTVVQVYLALGRQSVIERRPPKGVGWLMRATGLGRSAVYGALATLKDVEALIETETDWYLPTDHPSTVADMRSEPSTHTDDLSTHADESSVVTDHTSLLENEENPDTDTSTVVDTDLGFEEFWSVYPKRNGKKIGKGDALKKWRRLSYEDRKAAWRGARNYASACASGITIAADAHRWLEKRRWEDWQDPAVADIEKGRRVRSPIADHFATPFDNDGRLVL